MSDGTKPSELAEILKIREAKITKKRSVAEQLKSYNQPNAAPQRAKKKAIAMMIGRCDYSKRNGIDVDKLSIVYAVAPMLYL